MSTKSPIYVTIAERLRETIATMSPNSLLPTEEQLAQRFGVSRVTLRAALDLIESDGLISRVRGRGTIVNPEKITRHFSPHFTFERDMLNQNIEFRTRVLSFDTEARPPEWVRERLGIGKGEPVGSLSLVRSVEDQVVCHDQRFYPRDIADKIDVWQIESQDASKVLEATAGARVSLSDWESEIISASKEVADALRIASRTLVVANSYVWFLEGGKPGEAGIVSYRIDRCKFRYQTMVQTTNQ